MAFQTGTRVDPRLGALDFSGFTNAANIQAQGMMNLGESIGKGIEKYQKNKQITAKGLAELEVFGVTHPKLLASLRESEGEVAKALEAIESGDYKQRDVLTVNGAAKIAVSNALEAQTARLKALEEQINLQKLEEADFRGSVYEVDGVTFAQTSRGGVQVIDDGIEEPDSSTAEKKNFDASLKQIENAREAYFAGDINKANDIFTAANITRNGLSVSPSEYFEESNEFKEKIPSEVLNLDVNLYKGKTLVGPDGTKYSSDGTKFFIIK